MKRVVLLTVTVSLLLVVAAMPAAAQEGDTELSECNSESESYEDCLAEITTTQDVYNWLQTAPTELSDRQKAALYAYTSANSNQFEETTLTKIGEWKQWDNGLIERPEWFGSEVDSNETSGDDDEVNKWRQIRPGQWIVEKPEWYPENKTAKVVIYSDYDGAIALPDNGFCANRDDLACNVPVTNTNIGAGQTTVIWFDSTPKNGALDNNQQCTTLNSLRGPDGLDLAITQLCSGQEPFFDDPLWDYVWIVAVVSTLTMSILALLTYVYMWWTSRRLEVNGFEYLSENL